MTRRGAVLLGLYGLLCYVLGAHIGYQIGRTAERQSRDAVACTPFADSVRVVPRYRPSGPVPGATGRTP